jgi:hypothetical protein
MDSLNGSTVYSPNLDITLNFTVCRDIGASASDVLYPISRWLIYSIDDNQNITATPNIISRDISNATSHHGGPTQHETTHYSVTIDIHTLSEGWHKIACYIGVSIFIGENQLFGGLLDYRTFDPLYFAVGPVCRTYNIHHLHPHLPAQLSTPNLHLKPPAQILALSQQIQQLPYCSRSF